MAFEKMNIIIGDSWGVGEWGRDQSLSGPGIGQYLMLHSEVINLSAGAASNSLALHKLSKLLSRFKVDQDRIFWIVTDSSRCADMQYFLDSNMSIHDTAMYLLTQSFDRANALAEQYQLKIDLIGGFCDLSDIDISSWYHLNLVVPSWVKLIDRNYKGTIMDPFWWQEFGKILKTSGSPKLEEWIQISDIMLKKNKFWAKYFTTDGFHPNREGHKILRDYLFPEWVHKY